MKEKSQNEQARLIIIYADSGTESGGFHGPYYGNGIFEGIPIPSDKIEGASNYTYTEIFAAHDDNSFWNHIPNDKKQGLIRKFGNPVHCHFDPDPINLIYGDRLFSEDTLKKRKETMESNEMSMEKKLKKIKRFINPIASNMRKLQNGDLLVWAARLIDEKGFVKVYIIGWLMINYVLDFTNPSTYDNRNWKQLDNPHMKEEFYILENMIKYGEVIVLGKKDVGGQLDKAIQLTDIFRKKDSEKGLKEGYVILPNKRNLFVNDEIQTLKMIGNHELKYDLIHNLLRNREINNPKFHPID